MADRWAVQQAGKMLSNPPAARHLKAAGVPRRETAIRLAIEDVRTSLGLMHRDGEEGDWQLDTYGTARLLASFAFQFQQDNRALMSVNELRMLLRLLRASSHALESEMYLRMSQEDK